MFTVLRFGIKNTFSTSGSSFTESFSDSCKESYESVKNWLFKKPECRKNHCIMESKKDSQWCEMHCCETCSNLKTKGQKYCISCYYKINGELPPRD